LPKLRFIKKHNEFQIDYYNNGKRVRRYLGPDKKHAEAELKRVDALIKAKKLGFELTQVRPASEYNTSTPPISATPDIKFSAADGAQHISIAKAIDIYLERCKGATQSRNMAEKTYESKTSLLKRRFSDFLHKKFPELNFLDDIQKVHIESYRAYRINSRHKNAPTRKIKPTSFNNDLRELIAFFNYCIENPKTFYIFVNPASKVAKVQKADRNERLPCLSPEEITQVFKKCNGDTELKTVIETFIETGMRFNELRNLRWDDVDLSKNVMTVKSRDEFMTKSRKSRTIPISQRLREILKEIPRRSEKVFELNNVQRMSAKKDNLCNIRKRFDRIKKHLPFLRTGERFHIFRHTAITLWANSGVPLPVVQKWAGHSSIEMTMKYVHPSEEESAKWMKKFSDTQLNS